MITTEKYSNLKVERKLDDGRDNQIRTDPKKYREGREKSKKLPVLLTTFSRPTFTDLDSLICSNWYNTHAK